MPKSLFTFTKENTMLLKKEYEMAVREGKETFVFDGEHELLTSYAKYMLQHLSRQGLISKSTITKMCL